MIKATRIVIDGNKTFQACEIYKSSEIAMPSIFEDSQILIKDKNGKYIISYFTITCVQLTHMSPPPDAIKVKRVNIGGDITFSPAWIIQDFRKYGIPDLFGYPMQFSFISSQNTLFITSDVHVALIEI